MLSIEYVTKNNVKKAFYLNLIPCPSLDLVAIIIDASVIPFPHVFIAPPRDPEGHVPAIFNSGKNYLLKGVNILLGQPVNHYHFAFVN